MFDFQAIDILRNSQANVRLKVRKCQLEAVPDSIPPGQGQITLTEVPGRITLFNFMFYIPMPHTVIFMAVKTDNFQRKNCDIFFFFPKTYILGAGKDQYNNFALPKT